MWDDIKRLHEFHGEVPVEVRLLKLTEEVGEAAEALIGLHGHSRKGVWRTRDDLLDELADVIITAAVAMSALADNRVDHARSHFERRLGAVITRAGLDP
jgi:NTP pyrophosphatase (non-canonical NTP hydrolase)